MSIDHSVADQREEGRAVRNALILGEAVSKALQRWRELPEDERNGERPFVMGFNAGWDEREAAAPLHPTAAEGEGVADQRAREVVLERLRDLHRRNPAEYDEVCSIIDATRALSHPLTQGSEAMREALEWYGEQARLARLIHSEGDAGRHALAEDGGKRARAALLPQSAEPSRDGEVGS